MTATGSVKVEKFKRAVAHFQKEFSRDARLELKRQARLFVHDCIKFTPPFTEATQQESFNAQRRAGEKAVFNDLKRVFHPVLGEVNPMRGLSAAPFTGLKMFQDTKLAARARKYISTGNSYALEQLINTVSRGRVKFTPPVQQGADPELHRLRRNKRGRTRKGGGPYLVMDNAHLRRYIGDKMENVGLAKSGWQRPYYATGGAQLPAWISRHPVRGVYHDGQDARGFFERVGNDIPWIQDTGAEVRIMERAAANRARNMAVEMARLVQHARRKAGFS